MDFLSLVQTWLSKLQVVNCLTGIVWFCFHFFRSLDIVSFDYNIVLLSFDCYYVCMYLKIIIPLCYPIYFHNDYYIDYFSKYLLYCLLNSCSLLLNVLKLYVLMYFSIYLHLYNNKLWLQCWAMNKLLADRAVRRFHLYLKAMLFS